MAINLSDNIQVNLGRPVENKYLEPTLGVPYANVAEVNSTILEALRYIGLTVNVNNEEYWYATGTTDGDLIIKTPDVAASGGLTGATNGLTTSGADVKLGGDLTENTVIDITGSYTLNISGCSDLGGGNYTSSGMYTSAGVSYILQRTNLGGSNIYGCVGVDFGGQPIMQSVSGSCFTQIQVTTTQGVEIQDDNKELGLVYAEDYSTSGSTDPRWIPDNAYVTGLTSTIGAGNVGDVQLSDGASGIVATSNFNFDSASSQFEVGAGTNFLGSASNQFILGRNNNISASTIGDNYVIGYSNNILSGDTKSNVILGNLHEIGRSYWGVIGGELNKMGGPNRTQNATMFGIYGCICANQGTMFTPTVLGSNNIISGNTCVFGMGLGAHGVVNNSWATTMGLNGYAAGRGSFVHGDDLNASGFGGPNSEKVLASGRHAINMSANNTSQPAGYGALADHSVILGGFNQHLAAGNDNAALIGGNSIQITGSTFSNHVIVPNLAIYSTPADDADGEVLVWDSASKKVGKTSVASLGGITGGTNGITTSGNDVKLGGDLTENTTLDGNGFAFNARNLTNSEISTTGASATLEVNAKTNGQLIIKSQSGSLTSDDFTNSIGFNLDYNNDVFTVVDNRGTQEGLKYQADYSTTFTNRSLVDKAYVDAVATGLDAKESSILATTQADGNIDLTGGTFASGSTIDSLVVQDGWRVLIKNQTDAVENGIYDYSASASGFTRSTDFDGTPSNEVTSGAFTAVITGSTNANSVWVVATPDPITIGSTEINWSLLSRQLGVQAGSGTTITTQGSNNIINVGLAPVSGLDFDGSSCLRLASAGSGTGDLFAIESDGTNFGLTCGTLSSGLASYAGTAYGIASSIGYDASYNFVVEGDAVAGALSDGNAIGSYSITGSIGYTNECLEVQAECVAAFMADSTGVGSYTMAGSIGHTNGCLEVQADCVANCLADGTGVGSYTVSGSIAYNQNVLEVQADCIAAALSDSTGVGAYTIASSIGYTTSCLEVQADAVAQALADNSSTTSYSIASSIGHTNGCLQVDGNYVAQALAGNGTCTTYAVANSITHENDLLFVEHDVMAQAMSSYAGTPTYASNAVGYAADGTLVIDQQSLVQSINSYGGTPSNALDIIGYNANGTLTIDGDQLTGSVTGSTIIDANNGLSVTANTAQLGGALLKDTLVNTSGYGVTIGTSNSCATGAEAFALGSKSEATGNCSLAGGYYGRAVGNTSFAWGTGLGTGCANAACTFAFAGNAFALGAVSFGGSSCGTQSFATPKGNAIGNYSFAGGGSALGIPNACAAQSFLWGSAGGGGSTIETGNTGAALFSGAQGITLTGSSYQDTLVSNKFAIWSSPDTGSAADPVLVWDSSDKKVKQIDAANLGEDNNSYAITGITSATLTASEYVVLVQTSGATQTVTLPSSPADGQAFKIKDRGNALTNNITISGNGNNIDGSSTATINTDYGALELVYSSDADEWFSLAFIN